MCVRFIDCDSFQITSGDRTFPCPVGTPHFTPPELQGKQLRNTPRQAEHDLFGLAVLLFHLIFVGRHPFAGRYRGAGDLTVERAIAERRFAFSRDRGATRVDPPPASLLLEDIPPALGELFERAFRKGSSGAEPRPTAVEFASSSTCCSSSSRFARSSPRMCIAGRSRSVRGAGSRTSAAPRFSSPAVRRRSFRGIGFRISRTSSIV
jgi:DNA-binding helix-hairpin-helix protein with protein kinase domain